MIRFKIFGLLCLMLIFVFTSVHASTVSAGEEEAYFYDGFDDGEIDTDLWWVSGPVVEGIGEIILYTEGVIGARTENLTAMWFSAKGYQEIDVGEGVNIGMATRTPTGDVVIVGIYRRIIPPAEPWPGPDPYEQNYVFCHWRAAGDSPTGPARGHMEFGPAAWGHTYIFGLEYTPMGSIRVWVNGSVVHSYAVSGVQSGYYDGGAEFWFKADSVETQGGGDVTAKIDWAKAIEGMPPAPARGVPAFPSLYIGILAALGAGILAYLLRRRLMHQE